MTDDKTRNSFDDATSESDQGQFQDVPSGEELAQHHDSAAAVDPADVTDPEAEELRGEPVEDPTPGHADPEDMVIDDEAQLREAERVAAQARSSRPVRRKRSEAPAGGESTGSQAGDGAEAAAQPVIPRPVRRKRSTEEAPEEAPAEGGASVRRVDRTKAASQNKAVAERKRTTPAAFVGQSAGELRKVIWPTGAQLSQYFVVVLLFVLFIVAYVGLLDPAFGWVMLKFLGK
ncbi:preprotein translocase subunit SecE [Luteococcus sp. OSA5]|uniref:preprotein translocase subunit SecE n=1 Tax=Luteococcus sp. OSA5 TaxID=3401630 RepID=UPI003B42A220